MTVSTPSEVLLLMPPLTHLLCHTDIGIPQLTAYLRARGRAVTQMDLNARLLYRRLHRTEDLCALAGDLSLTGRRQLLGMLPYQRARMEQLLAALDRRGLPEAARGDAYWGLLQHLSNNERWQPELAAPLAPTEPDEATVLEGMTELSRALETSLFLRRALVSLVHDELFNPFGYSPTELSRALSRRPPRLLAELLDSLIAPCLTPALRTVGMTIHSTEQLVPALQICTWIKARAPGVHTVLGGPWAMAAAELLVEQPVILDHVDSVCLFEGEAALAALAEACTSPPEAAPGLIFRRGGEVLKPAAPPTIPLEQIPAPVFDGMTDDVVENKVPFRTVRGCHWGQCVFCHHVSSQLQGTFGDELGRAISRAQLDLMVEMLTSMGGGQRQNAGGGQRQNAGGGQRKVNMTLADTATPPETLRRIADEITRTGYEVGWEALVRFSDRGFEPEACEALAAAGCERLFFGLETADPAELGRLRKGISRELAVQCLSSCVGAGIETYVFLLDYPSAPPGSWRASLEFVLAHEDVITAFIPARFLLARNAPAFARPDLLGIEIPEAARESFSVFDLPFSYDGWQSLQQYEALIEEYTLALLAARGARPG